MKRLTVCIFLGLTGLFLIPQAGYAQTNSEQRGSDQLMNELLNEVRLLRQDIRRLSSSTYRAHTMIERLKLQQDQVNRLSTELSTVRTELVSIKTARLELKEKIAAMEKKVETGVVAGTDMNALKAMLLDLDQREPDLTVKESQLNGQLNVERAGVEELQKKLDEIELELQSISDGEKRPKRNP